MCGVLHNSQCRALFVGTSVDVCFTWVLHHLQKHVCCTLMSQLPQPFNYLLSPPNSFSMFPIWPFPDFSSQGTIYMLSFKILPPSFQPIFPFYPHSMSFEPIELMIFDTYISLLEFYDNTLYGIYMIKGYWNLWDQLVYKAWEAKNWLTVMSYSSFKL
jgi:hypothetical protein